MTYSTSQAARQLGVSRNTLLRWIREGKVPDGPRDRNGWRVFADDDLKALKVYADGPVPKVVLSEREQRMVDYFARVPMLRGLPLEAQRALAGAARFQGLLRGEWLYHPGDPCQGLYIVAKGRLRVYRVSLEGREQTLSIAEPFQTVAEAALFSPRHANHAVSQIGTTVILLPTPLLRRLVGEHPTLAQILLTEFSQRIHHLEERLQAQTLQTVEQRLARTLLEHQERHWTLADLASYLGVARETVSRLTLRWSKDGLVDRQDGHLVVLDGERLARL